MKRLEKPYDAQNVHKIGVERPQRLQKALETYILYGQGQKTVIDSNF